MNRPLISLAACASTMLFAVSCGSDEDAADTTGSSTTAAAATSSVAITASSIATPTTLSTATTLDPTVTTVDPGVATTAAAAATTVVSRVVTSPSDNVRKGDTGPGVEQIQTALKAAGYTLSVDGIFGDITDTAVRDYQSKNGLAVDGIVGPNTWAKLGGATEATTTTTTA